VIRHLLRDPELAHYDPRLIVFLDGDEALRERLHDLAREFRPKARGRCSDPDGRVFDSVTGEQGIFLHVSVRHWLDDGSAEVGASYHHDGMAGMHWSIRVVRSGRGWQVEKVSRIAGY
jgi:hypothetical protein